ncbi:mannosyl-oligosaccharide 1,2-alpha-mannosidase IA isoform X1 [Tachysurus ichikawai]
MPVAILMPFTATPSRKSVNATSFRLTEKFILLLVFSAFITFCFGAIFFLPDSSKLFFFRSDPAVDGDTRTGTEGDLGGTNKDDKILAKIRRDHEQALVEAKDRLQKRPDEIKQDIRMEKDQVEKNRAGENDDGSLPVFEYVQPPGATGREPSDPETREKRAKIKEVNKPRRRVRSSVILSQRFVSQKTKQKKGPKMHMFDMSAF